MCLLVASWHRDVEWPLILGANRDEWMDRPASPVAVLNDDGPRVLGGRDRQAGGTWLAVNRHGVVCGLTNRPMAGGPDPSRLSRGRLPLAAAMARSAEEATGRLVDEVTTGSYNPAWLIVGDRDSLHYLAVDPENPPEPRRLDPGLHVMENVALEAASAKADQVRAALDGPLAAGVPLWEALPTVLADHTPAVPASEVPRFPDGRERLAATLAPCVHSDGYGTRWSGLVRVGDDPARPPDLLVADGPPCTTPFVDAGPLWAGGG